MLPIPSGSTMSTHRLCWPTQPHWRSEAFNFSLLSSLLWVVNEGFIFSGMPSSFHTSSSPSSLFLCGNRTKQKCGKHLDCEAPGRDSWWRGKEALELGEVKTGRLGEEPAGLIAGFDAATAPGRTEHGSPTLCNVCTRHHVDHIPWCTGNHGNQETGSKPSWSRGGRGEIKAVINDKYVLDTERWNESFTNSNHSSN